MKVYYPGPGHETYHPELGKLVPGEPFDLDGRVARKYIGSGLLKRWEKPGKKKTGKRTIRHKGSGQDGETEKGKPEPPTGSSPDHSTPED